ncbi:PREDICTED: uncharacterized protein C22orf15 homolog isoform X2 [Ficedula albicollis]|uniref:uncharacterized protein C22orf15 homolog isoform X2 n=1 Tax=Ficedula albicollis TaxID=59894 RepID=UPI0007AD8416|nr:PREDICTED: uncharacterized protein C22orf15 homolog isoform X2 [Ficedula albicollis]
MPAGRDPAPQPCPGHSSTMFATVRFGDCIDLVDEKGTLMNLSKVEDPASEYASKYLQGRQRYILIRVVREENSEATSYESLLEDLGKHYPDLPDQLEQLSGKIQQTNQRKKSSLPTAQPQAKSRATLQSKRGLESKNTPK